MPFRLPRLPRSAPIVEEDRQPTRNFQQWWQSVLQAIEAAISNITEIISVTIPGVVVTADGALELAQGAINDGTFTIKDDKVLTDSMVDAAAALTSTMFYDAAGATVGTAGSYVDLPSGPAVVSILTGTKATQQCLIRGLVGVKRGGGANEVVTFRCRRDDGTILAQSYAQEATNDQALLPLSFTDPAPDLSTTHTYTVQINTPDIATEIREVALDGFLSKTG